MDFKELIISTLRGESSQVLPFIPRLDLWYKANKLNGTLPEKYANSSLIEITDDLGIGFHAVVPDFRDYQNEHDDIDLGLGIYQFKTLPYKVILHNIERKVARTNGLTSVEYITPYGSIFTKLMFNTVMEKQGATLAHVVEYAIKSQKDFKSIAYIFENIEVMPKYDDYYDYKEKIGSRGIVAAFNSLGASPMHFILKELTSLENFFFLMHDYPDEMLTLADIISKYYFNVFDIVSKSPAEIIFSGANYVSSITTPPFFERFILPSLKKQADLLHKNGKFLLTHTDGENKGLLELYLKCGFDIADSICPAPMTSLSLKEIRESFKGKITIWGGIPSISVLESSISDYEFDKQINLIMESLGKGKHMILSIADTTPPAASFKRLKRIIRQVKEFGPVK